MLKSIGGYYLDMPVREVFGLTEFTPEEYALFVSAGVRMIFRDERVFHGREAGFAGVSWKLLVGSTEGRIYRIALQHISEDEQGAHGVYDSAMACICEATDCAKTVDLAGNCFWESFAGTVILEYVRESGKHIVQVCLTSSAIRNQVSEKIKEVYGLGKQHSSRSISPQ